MELAALRLAHISITSGLSHSPPSHYPTPNDYISFLAIELTHYNHHPPSKRPSRWWRPFTLADATQVSSSYAAYPLSGLKLAVSPEIAIGWLKGIAIGVLVSTVAIIYSEVMFKVTNILYKKGILQRYYPLPKSRGAVGTWVNTFSFTIPTAIYAVVYQRGPPRSFEVNLFTYFAYQFLYMALHDTYFYTIHRSFHIFRPLYTLFHEMHHEYTHAMHVYVVGHAEMVENFIQVGIPFLVWTYIAGHNWWYYLGPLSFVVFSTLMGHSGYRSHPSLLIFHPLAAPVAFASGSHILTIGDHLQHHTHRRVNYGLFWRFWDKTCGTYRKCETRARNYEYWKKWAEATAAEGYSKEAKKWLGENQTDFIELEWGF